MCLQIDCPICLDAIQVGINCVTTECGHSFHANCLMQNVAHNGFGCPYCRTAMAVEPEEDTDTDCEDEVEEMFDDYALRGFRLFWNILNGEDHAPCDVSEEQEYDDWSDISNQREEDAEDIPTGNFVAQKLRDEGVSFEQLVKVLLLQHEEYSEDDEADQLDDELFGKIRVIISNYRPEITSDATTEVPRVAPETQLPSLDFEAQPKIHTRCIAMQE